ncbi:putative response regulatory protein [compost metagenome]
MRNLLIVDDEKNIRQGLRVMIEREYPGAYDIRAASHGEEAMKLHRERPADIILTDIRMPVMDGLRMIEMMDKDEHGERPALVILSGYDEFEYAKTAIRYQVKEYLLKPIRREELFAVLERIEADTKSRGEMKQQLAETDDFRRELRVSRLQQLIGGRDIPPYEMEAIQQQIGFQHFALPFRVVVLTYRHEDGGWMNREELNLLADQLLPSHEMLSDAKVMDAEGRLVWITACADAFRCAARQAETKALDGFLMGISDEGAILTDIHTCYEQALIAQRYIFTRPNENCVEYESVKELEAQSEPVPHADIRKLGNMLGGDREQEMKGLLQLIFRVDQLPWISISYLERVSREINEQVLDEVFRTYGEASMEVLGMYRKVVSLDNFRHFPAYYRTLEHLLVSLSDYVKQICSVHTGHTDMREAFAYIEANYHRMLNMAMVSNHVSLNYSYFSESFKTAAGESFVNYLKRVRIRHAKDKMSDPSLKLADISQAVGFENTKQFTRVFKELEGVTPQEYRAKRMAAAQVQPGRAEQR